MTTITKNEHGVKVNGTQVFTGRIQDVRQINEYKFEINTGWATWEVYGGKKAGGAANEWFVECKEQGEIYPASGAKDAVDLLVSM